MDHKRWSFTRPEGDGTPMDYRHVEILNRVALGLPHGALIAEIGSYTGASATAYIEAMIERPDLRLKLYEIKPHAELYRLLVEIPASVRERVTLIEKPAHESMDERAALVVIDGDHRWGALLDLHAALSLGCDVIAAHDTRIRNGKCEGSRAVGRVLRGLLWREWAEDCAGRKGEYTNRGLCVSWPESWQWVRTAIGEAEQ